MEADDLADGLNPGVELLRRSHRYAVVWPSVHPSSGVYRWYNAAGEEIVPPSVEELPELPDELVEHFRNRVCPVCERWQRPNVRVSERGGLPALRTGVPNTPGRQLKQWDTAVAAGNSRHDTTRDVMFALEGLRLGGHPDAEWALGELQDRWMNAATQTEGPDHAAHTRTWDEAQEEWNRMYQPLADNPPEPYTFHTPDTTTAATDKLEAFTDIANAERLASLHRDNIRYISTWGKWLVWDGQKWVQDPKTVAVSELAKAVARDLYAEISELATTSDSHGKAMVTWAKYSASVRGIDAMVRLTRGISGISIHHDQLDSDPWAFGVANGWIDLHTGAFHEPDQRKLMTFHSDVRFDPAAACSTWGQVLAEWLPEEGLVDYVQRLCGQALVGTVKDHILVIHYGSGANGKGTAIGAIASVFGPSFVVPHKNLITVTRNEPHDTVRAHLFRMRLAVAAETDRKVRLNEAQVKELTGGDRLSARRMREDPWEFEPTHSLWLQTNHRPEVDGRDNGIWRRIRIVPWKTEFSGGAIDRDLPEKLKNESSGILNWILEGVANWQKHGLTEPPSVLDATSDYRASEDKNAKFAADQDLEFAADLSIASGSLQDMWAEWCEANYGRRSRFNELTAWLEENGCTKTRNRVTELGKRRTVTTWYGIGIRKEEEEA